MFKRNSPPQQHPRSATDRKLWRLLATSTAMCLLSLLGIRQDWQSSIITLAFFAACAVVFLMIILRRRRERRWRQAAVRVVGSVNIPIDRSRFVYIATALVFLGALMCFPGTGTPLLCRLLGAVIGLVGISLDVAIGRGLLSRQFIRFEQDAFIVGEPTYRARIYWDNIAAISLIEYGHNPFVRIELGSVAGVRVEPPQRASAFLRHVCRTRGWMSADVALASRNFAIDGVVLANALRRYATQPDTRPELAPHERLAGPETGSA